MKHISFLIKPASALCNLRCRYCFYSDVSERREVKSHGLMSLDTAKSCIKNIFCSLSSGDRLTIAFQGGEPTLAGLTFFKEFVGLTMEEAKSARKSVTLFWALQTNGFTLDSDWCLFLKEHDFLVGLSLDGAAALHDENRVDPSGRGTHKSVMKAMALLKKHHVQFNVLWVLTSRQARYPERAWEFIVKNDIRFVQFIPCLSELGGDSPSPHALTPKRFSSFYTAIFAPWQRALACGDYRSIKFFDDVASLLSRGEVNACGLNGRCSLQFVVEADGSVYPCDFFALDNWKSGSLVDETPDEIAGSEQSLNFLNRPREGYEPCRECRFYKICLGGCPRMKESMYLTADGSFCGYRAFLENCGEQLLAIGRSYGMRN